MTWGPVFSLPGGAPQVETPCLFEICCDVMWARVTSFQFFFVCVYMHPFVSWVQDAPPPPPHPTPIFFHSLWLSSAILKAAESELCSVWPIPPGLSDLGWPFQEVLSNQHSSFGHMRPHKLSHHGKVTTPTHKRVIISFLRLVSDTFVIGCDFSCFLQVR